MEVYRRLLDAFGPQRWWPGEGGAFEVCAGAILTQSAAWTNAAQALTCLKEAGALSARALDGMAEEVVAELVRSSGYFNAKARKLKAFSAHVCRWYDGDVHRLLARSPRGAAGGATGHPRRRGRDGGRHGAVCGREAELCGGRIHAADLRSAGCDAAAGCRRRGAGPRCRKTAGAGALVRGLAGAVHGVAGGGCAALFNEYHALLVALGKDVCL